MKLLKLTLNNFQGIKSLTLDFDGRSAAIFGDNATGKTTVYNALTWLLFDKASTAAKGFTPKTRGADDDLHHLEHSSEAVFSTDEGRIVTLKKTLKEVYRKKRGSAREEFSGHTVDYEIDGVPVKEKEFNSAVLNYCGGDAEKIKMITMLDYFPEQLAWDSRRKILLEICGDITDAEIIADNEDLSELPNFLRMPGTADQYYSTDEYRKIATAKRAEINRELTEIPARIDEAEKAIPVTAGLNEDKLRTEVDTLEKERMALLEERAAAANGDMASSEVRQQLAAAKARLAEGRSAHFVKQEEANADIQREIRDSERLATTARRTAEDCDIDIRRKEAEYQRVEKRRAELAEEYKMVSGEKWDDSQCQCPTCKQRLPDDQIEELRDAFNLRRSDRLTAINAKGKREASVDMLNAINAEIDALRAKRDKAQATQAAEEARAEEYRAKLAPTLAYEDTDEYAALMNEINSYTSQLADAGAAVASAQNAIDGKLAKVDEQIRKLRSRIMTIAAAANQNKRIAELEKREKMLGAEYEELDKGLHLCDVFTKKKVDALTDRINDRFHSVRFRLFVEQINGGLKEDCEVMIPTDDGRLVPYAFANNAARINAGLEIIATLSDYWDVKMPVFVDNAESVTHLIDTDAQVVRLVVSEHDKRLRLEVDDG